MSAVNTRNKANTIESVAIPVGAIVVGACLFGLVKGLSALANAALNQSQNIKQNNKSSCLKSVAQIRAESTPLKLRDSANNNLETLKTEAFRQLAAQPFLVANQTELKTSLKAIDQAKSLVELKTAHQTAVATVESGHQQIFMTALIEAGKNATLKTGFQKLESLPSPLPSVARFAATDALGRTLITEITAPVGGDARVETEVVGVSDGSCNRILDDFDNALEAEGVRSQPAERKFTGGVCELAAVRDFLTRKVAPKSVGTAKEKDFAPASNTKRRQRLNQKPAGQKQK